MLASCARVVTRKTANAAAQSPLSGGRTLSSPHSVSSHPKKLVSNSKRFYAGHGHEEEAPKPYKRTTLSPRPADAMNSANDREREVQGIEGWIFGRKVTYIDPLKPIPNTEEQATANGWMWNKKVRISPQCQNFQPFSSSPTSLPLHVQLFRSMDSSQCTDRPKLTLNLLTCFPCLILRF